MAYIVDQPVRAHTCTDQMPIRQNDDQMSYEKTSVPCPFCHRCPTCGHVWQPSVQVSVYPTCKASDSAYVGPVS